MEIKFILEVIRNLDIGFEEGKNYVSISKGIRF
jgi:hypothetical protein